MATHVTPGIAKKKIKPQTKSTGECFHEIGKTYSRNAVRLKRFDIPTKVTNNDLNCA